jgi:hypothetical protein
MSLSASDFTDALWNSYILTFPTAENFYRQNLEQGVARHRPMYEIFSLLGEAVTTQLTSCVTFRGFGPGLTGTGVVVPDPPYQLEGLSYVGLPAAIAAAKAAAATSLGWTGMSATPFINSIIDSLATYTTANIALQFSLPQVVGCGGTLTMIFDPASLAAYRIALSSDIQTRFSTSPYFHRGDDPSNPPVGALLNMVDVLAKQLDTILATMVTTAPVTPAGSPPAITMAAIGGVA